MDEIKTKKALKILDDVAGFLDSIEWQYKRYDNELYLVSGCMENELPIDVLVRVHKDAQSVSFISRLPMEVEAEQMAQVAAALAIINIKITHGAFDYSPIEGTVSYKISTCYKNSIISRSVYNMMLDAVLSIVGEFNNKLIEVNSAEADMMKIFEIITREVEE